MKVLVISSNRLRSPEPVLPYGAAVAAAAAAGAGHEVRLLDLMFEREPERAAERACREFRPDVVGLSVRNLDNNDMGAPAAYHGAAAAIAAAARRGGARTLVLGGAAMAVMPEALLRATGADLGVAGPAEEAFPALLAALAGGGDPLEVPGVCGLGGGEFRAKAPHFPAADGPAEPYWRLLDLRAYRGLSAAPLRTKAGCPFDCVYCTYPAAEGREYRLRGPSAVAAEVRALAAAGARDIEFVDSVFNSPYEHALAVCEALPGCGARLHTCQLNPAFTDGPLLAAMRRAGFASIGVTAESADPAVLAGLGKNYGPAELERAAEAVLAQDLPCMWVFLLGGPGETHESVARTLAFARKHVRRGDAAFFNAGIRIYPGTGIAAAAERDGLPAAPAGDPLEPVFYLSPALDRARLRGQLEEALAANLNFAGAGALALPFLPRLAAVSAFFGMKPPLWRHTRLLRGGLRAIGVNA